jgi:hypothetical protein
VTASGANPLSIAPFLGQKSSWQPRGSGGSGARMAAVMLKPRATKIADTTPAMRFDIDVLLEKVAFRSVKHRIRGDCDTRVNIHVGGGGKVPRRRLMSGSAKAGLAKVATPSI